MQSPRKRTTSFLRRNISSCPSEIKAKCYTTLVRPIMEYACIIWNPITQINIRELEMVQRRAARFVTGDYRTTSSVTQMLKDLQWIELQECRKRVKTIMLYRIIHHLVAIPPEQYLIPRGVAFTTRGHDTIPTTLLENTKPSAIIFSICGMNYHLLSSQLPLWKDSKTASRHLLHVRYFSFNCI